jgi:hypothetical protein
LCANEKAHKRSHCGHAGTPGIPRGDGFTVSFVVSPETGFVASVPGVKRQLHRQVDTSIGVPGRYDFAVRKPRRSSFGGLASIASRTHVRDDRETPLLVARDGATCAADFRKGSTAGACDPLTRRANQCSFPSNEARKVKDKSQDWL